MLDAAKVSAHGVEVIDPATLGSDELIAARHRAGSTIEAEICAARRARARHRRRPSVPPEFPLFVADHLRANGIELTIDDDEFVRRRRVKSAAELEGIRRAQKAADAAMGVAAVADPRAARRAHLRGGARGDAAPSPRSTAASCPTR